VKLSRFSLLSQWEDLRSLATRVRVVVGSVGVGVVVGVLVAGRGAVVAAVVAVALFFLSRLAWSGF
jgi:hypothetical protein